MDTTIQLIDVLAWPITLLVIIFGFRKYFANVISRLNSVKAAGISLGFSDKIQQAKKQLERVQNGSIAKNSTILSHSPYQELIQRKQQLDAEIFSKAAAENVEIKDKGITQVLDALNEKGILPIEQVNSISIVNNLISEATPDINEKQANEVSQLIDQLRLE